MPVTLASSRCHTFSWAEAIVDPGAMSGSENVSEPKVGPLLARAKVADLRYAGPLPSSGAPWAWAARGTLTDGARGDPPQVSVTRGRRRGNLAVVAGGELGDPCSGAGGGGIRGQRGDGGDRLGIPRISLGARRAEIAVDDPRGHDLRVAGPYG